MSNKREKIDPYVDAKNNYVKLRDKVIAQAKKLCVDENAVKQLEYRTNEWLKEINDIHLKSKYSKKYVEIDSLLSNLLKFATIDNTNSVSAIKDNLNVMSEQDIKYSFNGHLREIDSDFLNSGKHIQSFQENPEQGRGR